MALIIIENEPKKTVRPSTIDSTMFVGFDGVLYYGYYLTHSRTHKIEAIKQKIK